MGNATKGTEDSRLLRASVSMLIIILFMLGWLLPAPPARASGGKAGVAEIRWELREAPEAPLQPSEGGARTAKPGDILTFGHYEQDNDEANGKEPIRWVILSVEGDRALLVSEENLDSKPYHAAYESVTWEGCTLRRWLNGDFLNAAFTAQEQQAILRTTIKNENPLLLEGADSGRDTTDRVFLLSLKEAEAFPNDASRKARNTAYAKARGAYDDGGFGSWWLRTSGFFRNFTVFVFSDGSLSLEGRNVDLGVFAVRPALYVDLTNGNVKPGAAGDWQETGEAPETPLPPSEGWAHTAKPGDILTFGHYEQDNNRANGQEPIRWVILSKEGDRALLVSEENLDSKPYNEEYESVTWEGCTLRRWLNRDFLNAAFTAQEQNSILQTMIENGDNPLDDGSDGGNDTMDKVFLLSLKEAELFPDAALRRARNTAWAEAQGAWNDGGFGVWLLRSPGIFERFAAHVFSHGSLDYEGDDVDRGGYAVRPAVYVDLANGNGMAGAAGNLWEARETPVTPLLLAEGWVDSAKPGDVLLFGHCEQDNNGANGQEPIRWIILSMEGGRALLVSERNLDSRPYHTAEESVTWEGCALRKWLNGDFLNAAFTAGEQDAILRTQVANEDNPVYGTPGGSGTTDKVFLLSLDEAEGLLNDAFRKARNTAWAEAQGTDDKGGFGFWWLRSPGDGPSCAALVSCEGFVDNEGDVVDLYGYAVRPALYIGLSYGNGKAGDAGDWQETEEVSQTTLLPEEGWASAAKLGDILIFGHYEQDNDRANGKEPIRWIILSMEGDRALLVSEENLDCKLYHTKREAVTWEECSLRQWLNSEFLFAAFTEGEQDAILQTLAANADNPEYGTDGGKSTVDKAFLLSVQGAELLFQTNDVRRARNTAYTRAQGAVEGDGCGWWWLRTPGEVANNAAGVNPFGSISTNGLIAVSGNGAVRPALYIDLSYGNGKAGVAKDWRAAGEASEKPFLLREGVERTAGPGDILIFGYYEQDNNKANGKEPIRWIIHSIGGINALLVSEQNLDCKPYHTKREAITWEKCALRQWLNGEFLSAAFTVGERDAILRTHLANRDNPVYGTDGGNSTTDKVFLMSLQGAETFPNDELRRARNTDYTRARGAADGDGCGWWWLRTPGEAANYVTGVNPYGGISANGLIAVTVNGAVRPALCVALSPCVF